MNGMSDATPKSPGITRPELDQLCARHGVKVDDRRGGAGKFADLYIGTGASMETLARLRDDIVKAQGFGREIRPGGYEQVSWGADGRDINLIRVDRVDNPEHEDFGKPFLFVGSFWDE